MPSLLIQPGEAGIISVLQKSKFGEARSLRKIQVTDYSSLHLSALGEKWAEHPVGDIRRYYAPIPVGSIVIDSKVVEGAGEELVGSTSITPEFIGNLRFPCNIKAPMNLGNNHWTGFAIAVNAKKEVVIQYMDSMNDALNWLEQNPAASREVKKIEKLFEATGYKVTKSAIYPDVWKQPDGVSCGAFFMENADRAFGEDKWEGRIPTAAQIREQQLGAFGTAVLLKEVSSNESIAKRMQEYVKHNGKKEITRKALEQMFEKDPEFKALIISEYLLESKTFESTTKSALEGVQRAVREINTVIQNVSLASGKAPVEPKAGLAKKRTAPPLPPLRISSLPTHEASEIPATPGTPFFTPTSTPSTPFFTPTTLGPIPSSSAIESSAVMPRKANTRLTEDEVAIANAIGGRIALDLFQSGAEGRRKSDADRIKAHVTDVLTGLKQDGFNILLIPDKMDNLVGKHCSDRNRKWRRHVESLEGLAQMYYDKAQYTVLGLITGGIQMPASRLDGELQQNVKAYITSHCFGEPKKSESRSKG